MLDVIFQLILFFLVSTTLASLPGITVNLPESATAEGADAGGITITVSAEGAVWLNERQVTLDALDSLLAEVQTGEVPREEYPVTVAADEQVTNGTLVRIFDALRRNGLSAVTLRTTEP